MDAGSATKTHHTSTRCLVDSLPSQQVSKKIDMQQEPDPESKPNPYTVPQPSTRPVSTVGSPTAMANYGRKKFEPFKAIWFEPRLTIERIIGRNPKRYVIRLACLSGVVNWLFSSAAGGGLMRVPSPTVIGLALVAGPLLGIVALWVSAAIVRLTGLWLDGHADIEEVRDALAWGSVPALATLPIWFVRIMVSVAFAIGVVDLTVPTTFLPTLAGLLFIVEVGLCAWSLVTISNTVAEVQRFRSAWRGFGNLLIAGFVTLVLWMGAVITTMYVVARLPF